MEEIYYIIEDGASKGPYSKDALGLLGITKESFVWREGLSDWVKAGSLQELNDVFEPADSAFGAYAQEEPEAFFAMFGQNRVGPESIDRLIALGLRPDTPVWRNGMADWIPASQVPEIMSRLAANGQQQGFTPPPPVPPSSFQSQQPNNFGGYQPQGYMPNQGYQKPHTNWMTWAIVGTVFGFLFCCIGGIIGCFAISKASSANSLYAQGNIQEAELQNSSAKTLTIITLIISAISAATAIAYYVGTAMMLPLAAMSDFYEIGY